MIHKDIVIILCPYFNMEEFKTMTDKKKISILERLLNKRDEQIQELQKQNVELQAMLDKYSYVDDDIYELKEIIEKTKKLTKEFNEVKNEQLRMTKAYKSDVNKFMRKNKIRRFR